MQIIINNHPFRYEMENIARQFFAHKEIEIKLDEKAPDKEYVLTEICGDSIFVSVDADDKRLEKSEKIASDTESVVEWQMARLLYSCLCLVTGKTQKWGLLTGVRPTRLVHRMFDEDKTPAEIRDKFINFYNVSEEKFRLVYQIAKNERPIISTPDDRDFSLYISIPFCPSRCNYCSFVSSSIEKFSHIIPEYVQCLSREIEFTAEIVKKQNLRLKSVYFGGGTPTTLTAEQLAFLMKKIEDNFDLSNINEYTVEAGRPDTVTESKLRTIKDMGADRISINPQTFNDEVLKIIGRKHTTEQTYKAYDMARKIGFKTINMDLIAGLSGDSFESFVSTLEKAISLSPENITLHTLTVKRAADLSQKAVQTVIDSQSLTEKMVEASFDKFYEALYAPYYMYRQKGTLSNLENVGYCKEGHEGFYNIYIMDEVHSILALGAGAVTKLKVNHNNDIQRIFNYKFPLEYIRGFDNIINRKREVESFFEKHSI